MLPSKRGQQQRHHLHLALSYKAAQLYENRVGAVPILF
ncbi:hypothetical protein AcetOrient_orf01968 [Acetobacter orientalis]|uniref:Uncharacterized protein n=1 Tax=Acetobacter orientalis TaxID=146474 RepID=A0A2Z5ZGB5_9PROT|nr:hypothetical protein AcetOrient_orf01968 [Acetobacter orientalis]